ncbi:MAG: ABC transporter substrate-binding protein [Burkholderiales bacterium]|nr:ABC transporter substrate-binding protein [Burkholderiales bacterium]OJX07312.1 MAG: ABC transporter substrate-binding protein [Burkholderiales bacterium 70-64]
MSQKDIERSRAARPSRRAVLGAGSAAGLSLMAPGALFAQPADASRLRIGFISPRTGPLAGFGEADGHVLDLARKALAGGLTIGSRHYAVEIIDRDTQSDPSRASQLAKALIGNEKVDLVLVTSAPETVNPVSDACEAAGVPCLSTVMPWEAWYFGRGAKPGEPSPFKWSFHFSFGVKEFLNCYLSQWSLVPNNRKVAALLPNDADGNAIRGSLAPALRAAGYTIVDAGPYETGTTDFSAQIAKFKAEKCELFVTFPIPPDFATFWRQAAQQGFTKQVKVAQVAKTGLFPSTVEALGPLGFNLSSGCYWHKTFPYKSLLTGVTGAQLVDGYEAAARKQWNQQLGASMSLIDLGVEALKTSTNPKDKAAVAKALGSLKATTMMGTIDFTKGPVPNVATAVLIGTQWVKAPSGAKYRYEYVITENSGDRNIPVASKLLPYA